MTGLFWPGDHRAGSLMSESALVRAAVEVEAAWLAALVEAGIAEAADPLVDLVDDADLPALAVDAEAGGNPVIPLVRMLRERLAARNPVAATWLHRGLTSQDVLDTALVLCARAALAEVDAQLVAQAGLLAALADRYRDAGMVARTLTQHAVPYTFGGKAASWLHGVLDAAEDLRRVNAGLPAQFGGAAGTLAAATELAELTRSGDPPATALGLAARTAVALGLAAHPPWHTARAPITRIGDALCGCTDAFGRIANDVLTLSRPEIGELAEPVAPGRGESSAMPHKSNPVLSVLVRRAALAAPSLTAQLHLAAAEAVDERPDGGWHVEWQALHLLTRHAVVAAAQMTELLRGLRVDTARMRATLDASADDVHSERRSLAGLVDGAPDRSGAAYLGAANALIDAACARAQAFLGEHR